MTIASAFSPAMGQTTSEASQTETASADSSKKYPEALISLPEQIQTSDISPTALVVDKTERILKIYKMSSQLPELILEAPTDLGRKGGDKTKSNDFRTPTGIYFLGGKKTPPEIPFDKYGQLAFETDYPNFFDRLAGKTGSGIWLHAVPDKVPLTRGSRGCVVVRNNAIKEIEKYVLPGKTPLLILDRNQEIGENEYLSAKKTQLSILEDWRKAWEKQDLESYLNFYHDDFKSAGMNLKKWKSHKENLKRIYTDIKIELSEKLFIRNGDQIHIRFLQRYQAKQHVDYGEKTLIGKIEKDGRFKILSENWMERPTPNTASAALGDRSQ